MKVILAVDDPVTANKTNSSLKANLKDVVRWSSPVSAYSSGGAMATMVTHDLNAVPNVLDVDAYVDARVWADQDDRAAWTATQVIFRTSHQGTFIVKAGVQ